MRISEIIGTYAANYDRLMTNPAYAETYKMPSGNYFMEDGSVLALPREDGDSRYPYGENGFNFWTYGSGYMHCNEGLFSPFLRATEGQEPKIAFFAGFPKEGGQREVVSVLGVPVMPTNLEAKRYTVFTMVATYFICEVNDLRIAVRVFVDGDNSTYFSVHVKNLGDQAIDFQLSYYMNPFVKNALVENSTDRWFRQVSYETDEGLGHYVIKAYEEVDRSKMAPNMGVYKMNCTSSDALKNHQVTTSRFDFVGGSRSSLHTPKALLDGGFVQEQKVCSFTETAIMGGILDLSLSSDFQMDSRFSYCFDDMTLREQLRASVDCQHIEDRLTATEVRETSKQSGLQMTFNSSEDARLKPKVMNSFMVQLKKQVSFCSVIKGYVQLSGFSLIGIRDIFQALEGVLYYEKETARGKMIEALNFVTKEGRCPRQYVLPAEKGQLHSMDLRPFIDQGVWVISTVVTYLKFTKDYDFLRVPVGYYEFVDEHKHLARQAEGEGTVLTHMIAIMDYLLKNRDVGHTECIYALYGDWNDALDGLGKSQDPSKEYGTGVSVMATLQVYQNLQEMMDLLQVLGNKGLYVDNGQIAKYQEIKESIADGLTKYAVVREGSTRKILHGWGDHRSYFVGSFLDPDGVSRDGLTSNAFWILSDMLKKTPELKTPILEAFERLKGKYGLKTFHPPFEMHTEGVGRIPNLPAGTAENGATYIHASLFGVMALFKAGESDKAWEELIPLLPFTHDKISCSPFVMPNSYGYNEALHIDGESMADWQTGSSNVLLKLIVKYICGFEPDYDGVYIQPAASGPMSDFSYTIRYLDTDVRIFYRRTGHERRFTVDGKQIKGIPDESMGITKLWLEDKWFLNDEIIIEIND